MITMLIFSLARLGHAPSVETGEASRVVTRRAAVRRCNNTQCCGHVPGQEENKTNETATNRQGQERKHRLHLC
ncbi:hypothetical protein EDD21DRAFT_376148 [Dissophora ornata]|nr:hypothetical protein EDD21DRAFT_376148 [Dissophora ornata]